MLTVLPYFQKPVRENQAQLVCEAASNFRILNGFFKPLLLLGSISERIPMIALKTRDIPIDVPVQFIF